MKDTCDYTIGYLDRFREERLLNQRKRIKAIEYLLKESPEIIPTEGEIKSVVDNFNFLLI